MPRKGGGGGGEQPEGVRNKCILQGEGGQAPEGWSATTYPSGFSNVQNPMRVTFRACVKTECSVISAKAQSPRAAKEKHAPTKAKNCATMRGTGPLR